jgi:hypothetical protein
MAEPYRQIDCEQIDDVWCVRLRYPRLPVGGLEELTAELDRVVADTQCSKMVISLGPEEPQCLYSMFLAKLVSLQKHLQKAGGGLVIAEASDTVQRIFGACRLQSLFTFLPDRTAALTALRR